MNKDLLNFWIGIISAWSSLRVVVCGVLDVYNIDYKIKGLTERFSLFHFD